MQTKKILSLMQKISNAYLFRCNPLLEEFSLPLPSFHILMFLANHPEYCTAKDISSLLNIKPNVISFHVNRLVEDGYLTRSVIDCDRRKQRLQTTEKANPIILRGQQMEKSFCDCLKLGISAESMEILGSILLMIGKNADQILGKGINDISC